MKRLVFSLINVVFLFISCNSNSGTIQKEDEPISVEAPIITTAPESVEVTGIPIKINTDEFIKNIHDFNNTTTWKYKGTKPCIVDFYADWCRPCKMMDPIMEKLAKEYEGKVIFYRVNIDENKDLSLAYNISSIPTFLFCPVNGQPQLSMGMMSEENIRKIIGDIFKQWYMSVAQETHEGKIIQINDQHIQVQISLKEACQNCANKKSCMILSSQERVIDIVCNHPQDFQIGETVEVEMTTSIGLKAVLYAYVLPVFFLMVSIIVGTFYFKKDIIIILIGLGVLMAYYFILYLQRKKINQTFTFSISKKS